MGHLKPQHRKKLAKAIASTGKSVTKKDDAVEASVISSLLQPKELPKPTTTDFGDSHPDWKHWTYHAVKFWNHDVAELMMNKELSFIKRPS